ncbi:hypothetical protein C8A00DRAFT_14874 [Chaetomidium leptoderma]|uniref:Uncharacterized protein n=1 Tax=Chaetomidium leptoderma TaxID=669021 RepID=A0AAN6VMA5_9PEZI|nr:hypothetical protein C8A00DRAFT_14874 [Chaetomidium leptoderma]
MDTNTNNADAGHATNSSESKDDETSLRTITKGPLGYIGNDAIDAPVPEVRATTEERFRDSDVSNLTHVVIQVTVSRQRDIFRYIGYKYDWNQPGPFWHFLGKMVTKALLDDNAELRELNFVAIGRREFIASTTPMWRAAVEAKKAADGAELPPLRVIEVNFKKPQPGKPLEFTWAPARPLFAAKIKQSNTQAGNPDLDHQGTQVVGGIVLNRRLTP